MSQLLLDFYSVRVLIEGEDSAVVNQLRDRFEFFSDKISDEQTVKVTFFQEKKDLTTFPWNKAIGTSPRNIFYRENELLYADYFGDAFTIYNSKKRSLEVYCQDTCLTYEIIYLFILSQVGDLLERKGIYRTHGLGFSCDDKGVLILLPSGGGKSSLGLRILKNTQMQIISEDCPLVGKGNCLYSFPTGIGVSPPKIGIEVPTEDVFSYTRMEFDDKTLVLPRYYVERIETKPVPLNFILIGSRALGDQPSITSCSIFTLYFSLLKKMVVGLGLFQGIEYLLHRPKLLKPRMILLLIRRSLKALWICFSVKKYSFCMSYDYEKNFEALQRFLKEKCQ